MRYLILYIALHDIIFTTHTACALDFADQALKRALERWRLLWDVYTNVESPPRTKPLGFYRNASEYWYLAKLYLDVGMPRIKDPSGEDVDVDSMESVNAFIKGFAGLTV